MKNFEKSEAMVSKIYHSKGTPLLVSSVLLRQLNCGQVDVATIQKNLIKVIEVKSGSRGVSKLQRLRLKRSCEFLSSILNKNSVFIVERR